MRKLILLLAIVLFGCNHAADTRRARLNDTLAKIKILADFKPLDQQEAYDFLNKYYLPRLDSTPMGRKIFINPMTGKDFKQIYDDDKLLLEAKYNNDTTNKKNGDVILTAPHFALDKYVWDSKKLANTTIVTDSAVTYGKMYPKRRDSIELEAWNKKFGFGYMIISYPQYNQHTKKLLLLEYLENTDFCGTGKSRDLFFTKNINWMET